MAPSVSVVITTWNRDPQLANTLASISGHPEEVIVVDDANQESTAAMCKRFGVSYIQRLDRPHDKYASPSVPINVGLWAAKGDLVILQNAECRHDSNVVEQFRARVKERTAIFAKVQALKEDGSFGIWYTAPKEREMGLFFCGAMFRRHFLDLGGMDEDFDQVGYEDQEFATRMKKAGFVFEFADDILASHQWHYRPPFDHAPMLELYMRKHFAADLKITKIWPTT